MNEAALEFSFEGHFNVRIQIINGEPWFCLKDVCEILSVSVASPDRFQMDMKGVTKNVIPTAGGHQQLTFVSEPNLYRVIFRSNKPEARKFQDWVFNVVLPAIRRTGRYELYPDPPVECGEPLSRPEYDQLVFFIDDLSKTFHFRRRWVAAIWYALRRATGNPSPNPMRTTDLPVIVQELHRIAAAAEHTHRINQIYESEILSRVIRGGEAPQDIDIIGNSSPRERLPARFTVALNRIAKLQSLPELH